MLAVARERSGRRPVGKRHVLHGGPAALLRATDALKQFDLVMAITGPNDAATQTLSTLLYQVVFRDGKVGLGASYACLVLVVVMALATIFVRHLERLQRRPA